MRNPFAVVASLVTKSLHTLSSRGNWFPIVREGFAGAWQQNIEIRQDTVIGYPPLFACITLIASDIAKLPINLIALGAGGVWVETSNPAYSPILRKPNTNQNRIQFVENWIISKLSNGNAYGLKVRDGRGVVTQIKILDPTRVVPLVADNGDVFYQLSTDNFAGLEDKDAVVVPASEIIHDRFNCLFHPLVGISPIFAAGLAAMQGVYIQENSAKVFKNGATAPGILTAAGAISDPTAARLKEQWESTYSGNNFGKVAVLGDGLKFERMALTSVDSQLIQQLGWTAEMICAVFHVPPYKIGVGAAPPYTNIQSVNLQYYSQCLQSLIEAFELCLDEGIALPLQLGVELDVDNLLRMDSATQAETVTKLTGAGLMKLNEGRKKFGLAPMAGGNVAFLQQQNFSVEALNKRDKKDDPFATASSTASAASPATEPATTPAEDEESDALKFMLLRIQKEFGN